MKFTTVENLVWCDEAKTSFNCDVTFEALGKVPFHCTDYDNAAHTQEIWERANAGEFGPIADWVMPPITLQEPQIEVTDMGAA